LEKRKPNHPPGRGQNLGVPCPKEKERNLSNLHSKTLKQLGKTPQTEKKSLQLYRERAPGKEKETNPFGGKRGGKKKMM